jgi:hypothetical protein
MRWFVAGLLVLAGCAVAPEEPAATGAVDVASESVADEEAEAADEPGPDITPDEEPTPTLSPASPTPAAAAEPAGFVVTGVIGVEVGREGTETEFMTCWGLIADDGTPYDLHFMHEAGVDFGAMVTADGGRVKGSTTKEVVGVDYEDTGTGEVVATAGDRVTVTAPSPPSQPTEGFSCGVSSLTVIALEVHR